MAQRESDVSLGQLSQSFTRLTYGVDLAFPMKYPSMGMGYPWPGIHMAHEAEKLQFTLLIWFRKGQPVLQLDQAIQYQHLDWYFVVMYGFYIIHAFPANSRLWVTV